jgi:hypothetical protein
LRQRIGLAGRRTVEQKYSAEVQAPRVFEIFQSVVQQSTQDAAAMMRSASTAV